MSITKNRKYLKKLTSFFYFGIVIFIGISTSGCISVINNDVKKEITEPEPARFEIIEEFRMFDNSNRHSYASKVIRDREKPENCYFFIRYGGGNGGVTMTKTECPK